MLLDKLNDNTIASLRKKAGDQTDFQREKYRLFFQYDTAAGSMKYLAVRKDLQDDGIPLGYAFSIGSDLQVHASDGIPFLPLLLYLRAAETGLSEESQKALYGDAYYTLGAVAGLSPKQIAERTAARQSFLKFLDHLREKGLLNEEKPDQQKLTLRFEVEALPTDRSPLLLRMRLGQKDGKLYAVQNAKAFCQALKTGSELTVRPRFSVHLTPDAFEEAWQPLMDSFSSLLHTSTGSASAPLFLVSAAQLPAFLLLLPEGAGTDALVSEKGNWTIREEKKPASVSLDSAGSLTFSPKLSKTDDDCTLVISGRKMAMMLPETREAVVYTFEDYIHAELYDYFSRHQSTKISYVSDLLLQKVLPVSSGLLRKAEDHEFRITVHVSLEDEALHVHTAYWIGREQKDASFFEGKPFEQAMIHSCTSALQALHATDNGVIRQPEDVLFFLQGDLGPLRQLASVYVDDSIRHLKVRPAPQVQIRAAKVRGWLTLSFHSSGFTREELESIYAAYRKKKSFFLLKDNLILLEPEKMALTEDILEEAGAQKGLSDVRLPFYHAMLLDSYRENGADISMDEDVKEALLGVLGYKSAKPRLPRDLKDHLRPYQLDGVRWMKRLCQYGFSGILADDMGLGKSLEVLAFLASTDFSKPVLIVCPKSLVYNWHNEIRKWLGDVPVIVITGNRNARMELIRSIPQDQKIFCIAGYDSLRLDAEAYQGKSFFLTLADEAQNIKNASTQKAQAIRKISSDMRLALTGTPVENSLTDLWSICDYLMPGYLGTEAEFRKKYESEGHPENARQVLAKKVAPFLLRRRKEDVLDSLPPKELIQMAVSMTDEQRSIYEAHLYKARELAATEKGVSVFSALTRLRQICVDPSVFLDNYDEMPAKLSVALDLAVSSMEGGHKVLVFSSFTRVLEHFRYYLEEQDIRSYTINGDTPGALRVEMADRFNREDRVRIMLVSIKAGGTGLNLVGADIVIHLDPWWNFAVEEQATDRAHRIGQTRPVTVYKLIAHDSIEEKVVSLQEEKRQASSDIVQTSLNGIDTLSQEDIRFILQ